MYLTLTSLYVLKLEKSCVFPGWNIRGGITDSLNFGCVCKIAWKRIIKIHLWQRETWQITSSLGFSSWTISFAPVVVIRVSTGACFTFSLPAKVLFWKPHSVTINLFFGLLAQSFPSFRARPSSIEGWPPKKTAGPRNMAERPSLVSS